MADFALHTEANSATNKSQTMKGNSKMVTERSGKDKLSQSQSVCLLFIFLYVFSSFFPFQKQY
jgi:hypothetical protein